MSGNFCIGCSGRLIGTTADGIYEHAASSNGCTSRLMNLYGFSVDDLYAVVDSDICEIPGAVVHPDQGPCDQLGPHASCSFCVEIWESQITASIAAEKALAKKVTLKLAAASVVPTLGKVVTPAALIVDEPAEGYPGTAEASAFPIAPLLMPRRPVSKPSFNISVDLDGQYPWRLYEESLAEIFEKAGLPRLGGASGTLGWSSFSTFQRCAYLWKRTYLDGVRDDNPATGEPKARVIGSAVHTYLAFHYQKQIDVQFPLIPDDVNDQLRVMGCNPEYLDEAWRLFSAYRQFYMVDPLVPMAVEYLAVDPKTGESCRFDMIARLDKNWGAFPAGAYVVEAKTVPRFGDVELTGWMGDGEIIGQAMLWKRLKLDRKFGKLQGVMMNLIGKQKDPEFTRVNVAVMPWQIKAHARDLQQTQALRNLFISLDAFPRSRANCVNRYGKCNNFEACANADRDSY
jgi:hypothetical protein